MGRLRAVADRGGLGPTERGFAYVFQPAGNLLPPWTSGNQVARRLAISYNARSYPATTELTWIVPPETDMIWITAAGSGGGGGGARTEHTTMLSGAGGGAGAVVIKCPVQVSEGDALRVIVPGGGAGGGAGENGADGRAATVLFGSSDSSVTAAGGSGGETALGMTQIARGGLGGVGLTPGQNGQPGEPGTNRVGSGGIPDGGHGGNCAFGRGSCHSLSCGACGSGGAGGTPGESADAGSRGGHAFIIIEW